MKRYSTVREKSKREKIRDLQKVLKIEVNKLFVDEEYVKELQYDIKMLMRVDIDERS